MNANIQFSGARIGGFTENNNRNKNLNILTAFPNFFILFVI